MKKNEKGFSLIEVVIALALLGIIAIAVLSGLATASIALIIADERTTSESLARSQMEYVKNCSYENEATSYPAASIVAGSVELVPKVVPFTKSDISSPYLGTNAL